MKKILLIAFVSLISLKVVNGQNIFIYNLDGEKEYFMEADSLFQIKFFEEPDIDLKKKLCSLSDIKDEREIYTRMVVRINRKEQDNLSLLRKNNNVKYINRSLKNSDGSILIPTDKVMVKIKSGNNPSDILKKLDIAYESLKRLGSDPNTFLITLMDWELYISS